MSFLEASAIVMINESISKEMDTHINSLICRFYTGKVVLLSGENG